MYEIGQACDVGQKRRGDPNQDAVKVVLPGIFSRRPPLLILADGMGGHKGGALASDTVIQTIARKYRRSRPKDDILAVLERSILSAHKAVRSKAKKDSSLVAMGSTVVAAVPGDGKLYIANVGDSRAYLVNSEGVRQLTQDHSTVAELLRAGEITPEEVHDHPQRSRLTMAISARRTEIEPYRAAFELKQEDIILMCSDGLWDVISELQIWRVVYELPPQQAADKLVEMANAAGGPDNISVIVARKEGVQRAALETT